MEGAPAADNERYTLTRLSPQGQAQLRIVQTLAVVGGWLFHDETGNEVYRVL